MGLLNPWCGLCGAERETWRYETRRTVYATMDEARSHLAEVEAENAMARRVFGDLHKGRPN